MGLFSRFFDNGESYKIQSNPVSQNDFEKNSSGVFFVEDVYFIMGVGVIPVGSVRSGIIRPGMKTTVNGREVQIKSIEANHAQQAQATVGQKIGIALSGVNKGEILKGQTISFG